MGGETDLTRLLSSLSPKLHDGEYVFCSFKDAHYGDYMELQPLAIFAESEGLTLIIPKNRADEYRVVYDAVFRCITLAVHSGLAVVGFTAAVSSKLAAHGIAANVVAAYHHDHIFIPFECAARAVQVLGEFNRR